MNVLVIGGGYSSEREVSLKSSNAVFEAAKKTNHSVEYFDWDGTDTWLGQNAAKYDVVLPILHGSGGEDGVIQALLEDLNIAFLGSDSTASSLCFNKQNCLELLRKNKIRVPYGELVTLEKYMSNQLYNQPHVLKPYDGGSSVDTFIYPDLKLRNIEAIKQAYSRHEKLLLEEFINGVEITVPVLDNKELPVIEISPPENEVFDYENKYNGKTSELIPPVNVSEQLQAEAKLLAQKIHTAAGCRHLSRVDMIVKNNELVVLEVNTMPGMTNQSLFPKAASASGMEFVEFVNYLINITAKKGV